jgi:mannan endo-1,4-beta-mannosidase
MRTTWCLLVEVRFAQTNSIPLLTCSIEGMGLTAGSDGSYPYTYYEGYDFEKNIGIPDIDFGVFHMYTSQCTISPPPASWTVGQ